MQQFAYVGDTNASVVTKLSILKTLPSQNTQTTRPESLAKKSEH